jgi:hypothetical protein
MPVADTLDGPLHPPLTERSFHVSDARQMDQASHFLAERAASIALAKARADAAARGDDPDEVQAPEPEPVAASESASARRARQKAEREAQRVASPL